MSSSYENIFSEPFSRKYGGTPVQGIADPHINGYNFVVWESLPTLLANKLKDIGNEVALKSLLSGTSIGYTIPGSSLSKTTFSGLLGKQWQIATNNTNSDSFSITFLEYQEMPITRIMGSWVDLVDQILSGNENNVHTHEKKYYVGTCYLIQTKPNIRKESNLDDVVEKVVGIASVFPTRDTIDSFSGNINTFGKVELTCDFNCDYVWDGDRYNWVRQEGIDAFKKIVNTFGYNKSPMGNSSLTTIHPGESAGDGGNEHNGGTVTNEMPPFQSILDWASNHGWIIPE